MYWIYGRYNCIFCDRAKALLSRHPHNFTFVDIEANDGNRAVFEARFPDAKTVPQIVYESSDKLQVIGGFDDLYKHLAG